MKVDREIVYLERSIASNDFAHARTIIEHNADLFSKPSIRSKLSVEALALLNSVLQLRDGSNKDLYSKETQLIINHLNSLARDCRFSEIKRFSEMNKELLSNPQVYNLLNSDAKAIIPQPNIVT